MKYFNLFYRDNLLNFIIALYFIYMKYNLLKKSFYILMLFTPEHIHVKDIANATEHIEITK